MLSSVCMYEIVLELGKEVIRENEKWTTFVR